MIAWVSNHDASKSKGRRLGLLWLVDTQSNTVRPKTEFAMAGPLRGGDFSRVRLPRLAVFGFLGHSTQAEFRKASVMSHVSHLSYLSQNMPSAPTSENDKS